MSIFSVLKKIKLGLLLVFIFQLFVANNELVAQDCVAIYGPTGEPGAGLEYKLCTGSPGFVNLSAAAPSATATYSWATPPGGVTNIVNVTSAGSYVVTVTDGSLTCVLNFNVTAYANPVVNLGNDTSVCDGDSITFYANPGLPDYIWSDGVTIVDSLTVTAAGTYSVTVSDTNQCAGIDTIVLTLDTLPTLGLGSGMECIGDTAIVDAGVGYMAYLWSTGQISQTILVDTVGTYSVTVTNSNGCEGAGQYLFSNFTDPIVNIGLDDSICDGITKTLSTTPSVFTSYLWSDATTLATASFTTTSDPWVEVTDTNGCKAQDTMHLEVYPLPVVNLGADAAFCVNDSVVLDAGAGFVSYSWNNGNPNQTLTVTTVGTYSVTVEDTNQCFGNDTNVVTQNALPNVNIGPDIEYCFGTTFSQIIDGTTPGAALYNWMDGTFTAPRLTTQSDDTVWLEVLDTNGCTNVDTMFVIENALPVLNLGPDDTICSSQLYSLNAGNPNGAIVSYNWSTGALGQTVNIPPNPNQINDSTANYSVTITDNKGCINMDTMTLFTYALPKPNLGNDTAFCNGDPFIMVLNPGVFTTYNWSTGVTTPTITITAVGATYTVTVTDGNNCSNTDDILVTDNPLPTPNLGPDEAFCQGNSFTKILNPGSFITYLWSDGSTGQVLAVNAANIYGVTVSDINNCFNSDNIIITENPSPNVDLGPSVNYCEDVVVSHFLDATTNLPGPGFNFLWNTGASTGTILATSFGTFTVVVTDQVTNCITTSSVDIVPMPKATPQLGDDGVVCEGQLITLDPQNKIPGYSYVWSTGATTATINVFEPGTYWVQMDATNGTCLGITDTIKLDPGVLPVLELGDDLYPCIGQKVNLLNNVSDFPGTTYEWQDGTVGSSYTATTTGLYEVEATNECGSVIDQVFMEFQDCANVYFPSSFTPNGDGKNDTFFPKSDQEFTEYGFWVYDRWGRLLFKTNTPGWGWDGKVNGDYAATGVYVWRISYVSTFQDVGERIEKIGEVTLIR